MAKVDMKDRTALERLYPKDEFASDAARNDLPNAIVRGVRVGSAPDESGCFELERAARHVGEPETPYFLAPHNEQDYERFLDEVITAAKRFGFRAEETPGQGDPRIKGLRQ
jgi:hypothetical protein